MSSIISADSLVHNVDVYNKFVYQIFSDISSTHKIGKSWILFPIPFFVAGHPSYDQARCLEHVCTKLAESKFKFRVLHDIQPPQLHLFVHWSKSNPTTSFSKPHTRSISEPNQSRNPSSPQKKVSFDALSNLDLTYQAMRNSGKLNHLKSFNFN